MIAVVSYNKLDLIPRDRDRIFHVFEQKVFVADNIFNPKHPKSVSVDDIIFKEMLVYHNNLDKIIIFAGKKSSGSLEIIRLFSRIFVENKEKLFFVLCNHDLVEKKLVLEQSGINSQQYLCFSDNKHLVGEPCDEQRILLGVLFEKLLLP